MQLFVCLMNSGKRTREAEKSEVSASLFNHDDCDDDATVVMNVQLEEEPNPSMGNSHSFTSSSSSCWVTVPTTTTTTSLHNRLLQQGMLDMLGNVFGRSKKEKGAPPPPASPLASRSSNVAAADFAVVEADGSGQAKLVYPTILTNEVRVIQVTSKSIG